MVRMVDIGSHIQPPGLANCKLPGLCTLTPILKTTTHLVDAEVLADVDDPSTQTSSSRRLGADIVGREAGVAHVILLHHGHAVFGGVVLVEVDEGLEEGVYIAHRLHEQANECSNVRGAVPVKVNARLRAGVCIAHELHKQEEKGRR
eukprot:1161047-Pelagomonas_calceolata.AAC.46